MEMEIIMEAGMFSMNMAIRILIIGIIKQMKWVMVETVLIIIRMVEEGVDTEEEEEEEVIDHVDEEGAEAEGEVEVVEWADIIIGVMTVIIMQTIQEEMEDRDMSVMIIAEGLRTIQDIDLGLVLGQDQGGEIDQERDRNQDRNIQNVNQNQAERKGKVHL